MGVSSSEINSVEANKPFYINFAIDFHDKDRDKRIDHHSKADNNTIISRDNGAINGINFSSPNTVGQTGGINRSKQPYSSGINRSKQPYSSGIYTVTIEASKKEGDIFAIEKGDIPKTPREPPKTG